MHGRNGANGDVDRDLADSGLAEKQAGLLSKLRHVRGVDHVDPAIAGRHREGGTRRGCYLAPASASTH